MSNWYYRAKWQWLNRQAPERQQHTLHWNQTPCGRFQRGGQPGNDHADWASAPVLLNTTRKKMAKAQRKSYIFWKSGWYQNTFPSLVNQTRWSTRLKAARNPELAEKSLENWFLKIGNFSMANKTIRRGIMFVHLWNVDSSLQKFTWVRNRGGAHRWNVFLKNLQKTKVTI